MRLCVCVCVSCVCVCVCVHIYMHVCYDCALPSLHWQVYICTKTRTHYAHAWCVRSCLILRTCIKIRDKSCTCILTCSMHIHHVHQGIYTWILHLDPSIVSIVRISSLIIPASIYIHMQMMCKFPHICTVPYFSRLCTRVAVKVHNLFLYAVEPATTWRM